MTAPGPTLTIDSLGAGYGRTAVLRGFSLTVGPGLTVILGPNGAGKSTLLEAVAGIVDRSGSVAIDGVALAPRQPAEAVRRGLALVPQGRRLFAQMTVVENLEIGAWLAPRAERAGRLRQVLADYPQLAARARQLAGTMSGGEQQMVAVARALMAAPRLLLLDEPSLGLAPRMVDQLLAIARRIADAGITVLMVEQNVRKALAVADRAHVLERGRIVASGTAAELARSGAIHAAYLGAGSAVPRPAGPEQALRPAATR